MLNDRRSRKGGEARQTSWRAGSGSMFGTAKQTRRDRPRSAGRNGGGEHIRRDVRIESVQEGYFQHSFGVRARSADRSA